MDTSHTLSADRELSGIDHPHPSDDYGVLSLFDLPEEIVAGIIDVVSQINPMKIVLCLVCKRLYARAFSYDTYCDDLRIYAGEVNSIALLQEFGIGNACTQDSIMRNAAKYDSIDVIRFLELEITSGLFHCAVAYGSINTIMYANEIQPDVYLAKYSKIAAYNGHINVLEWEYATGRNSHWTWKVARNAATFGVEILRWLIHRKCPHNAEVMRKAAISGNTDTIEYCRGLGYLLEYIGQIENVYNQAATVGNLSAMKLLYAADHNIPQYVSSIAAQYCNRHIIDWLKSVGEFSQSSAEHGVLIGGNVSLITEIYGDSIKLTDRDMGQSFKYGRLDLLKYLWQHGHKFPANVLGWGCHDTVVEWAISVGFRVPCEIVEVAAANGNTDLLKILFKHGYPKTPKLCASAARNGNLDTIVWLRDQGCLWDEDTCADAAHYGELRYLKLLRSWGCPWDDRGCTNTRSISVRYWAHANGCPCEHNFVSKDSPGYLPK